MIVSVFKTNVKKKDLESLIPVLDVLKVEKWNFDFEDSDHILRIESNTDMSNAVSVKLNNLGFLCSELY
jgi:hypothetical protein